VVPGAAPETTAARHREGAPDIASTLTPRLLSELGPGGRLSKSHPVHLASLHRMTADASDASIKNINKESSSSSSIRALEG
jgi:hypothetical protein